MYAVIKTGGKQYRLAQGDTIRVEKLDVEAGDTVVFSDVLLVADGDKLQLGNPFVDGISVSANVIKHGRAKKIEVIKFKRRKHHRKQMGHRQHYTEVQIAAIGDQKPLAKKPAASAKAAKPSAKADKPDDLKKLSGVGPKLAEKLNEAEIYSFQQIADLSADEIARIEEILKISGRFEKEGWVEQAKKLLAEK